MSKSEYPVLICLNCGDYPTAVKSCECGKIPADDISNKS